MSNAEPLNAANSAGAEESTLPAASELERLTPAMRQYVEQKRQVGDAILLFRMGDFYELFYDDAIRGAKLLGIALTSRDSGKTPLAGIPHHALESYVGKLVAAGCKVAISEQIEEAKQAKGIIKRALTRIITPGTLTDDALLDRSASNWLVAAWIAAEDEREPGHGRDARTTRSGRDAGATPSGIGGIAAVELSTGEFIVQTCPASRMLEEIYRLSPAEVLLAESAAGGRHPWEAELRERAGASVTYRPPTEFAETRARQLLLEQFETATLEGFGFREFDASLVAAGALVAYVRETQRGVAKHLRPPRKQQLTDYLVLDPATLRALEIERTIRSNTRAGSLLGAMDRTCNPMGTRLLRQWLCFPLARIEEIQHRQELIGVFRGDSSTRAAIRKTLREIGDLGRLIGRLGVQRASPRDLRAVGNGIAGVAALRARLAELGLATVAAESGKDGAATLYERLTGADELGERICEALRADAPLAMREGGIFNAGISAELDRLRLIGRDGATWLAEFQAREVQRTGIASLKVAFNSVFGYYIEISHAQSAKAPADYVRKQTVKNAERYITDELKKYETEVLSAESRANELEHEMFVTLRDVAAREIPMLQRVADAVAEIDVLVGLAELAVERHYCRPEFVESAMLEIEGGRHPVVEQTLGANFVPNDTMLVAGGKSLALITGPNMAGKSTYIRQVASLTLLAHCGSWVPAERMRLGAVDRIFTRVGASDELARGQSTFMVEMLETANILHNATARSLVILDEVGRGTSTYDGLALAWAISEHLASTAGCRTLFATHYHELTELSELLEPVFNLNVAVREYEDHIVFLHRIVAGAADRSYGVHVAKLAGVPRAVLERAATVLQELEKTFSRESQRPVLAAVQRRRQRQLRLFEAAEEMIVRQLRELSLAKMDDAAIRRQIEAWRKMLEE